MNPENYSNDFLRISNFRGRSLNFTITFNPYKFTDVDTIIYGPELAVNTIKIAMRRSGEYRAWFTRERHGNGRVHLHGQIQYYSNDREMQINSVDSVRGLLRKKCGITEVVWNDPTPRMESEYPTWYLYCSKEAKYLQMWENGDVSTKSRPIFAQS